MAELKTRIILRNDTTANWTQNSSVVLRKGEFGIEYTADGKTKVKIGDGAKQWAQLPYFDTEIVVDNDTIILKDGTTLAIKGYAEAETGAQLTKTASGLSWVVPSTTTVEGLQSSVTSLNESVATLTSDMTTAKSDIATLKENVGNVYTKTETDTKIGEAVAQADHLQRKIVTQVSDINPAAEGADKYIYLVPKTAGTNDSYDEYMVIEGKVEKVGDWGVDLSGYVTTDSLTTTLASYATNDALNTAKAGLLGTEDAAIKVLYDNTDPTIYGVAQKLKALGEAAPVIATSEKAGLVLSSSEENTVTVDVNGKMTVNSLSVTKLTQTEGDTLILNCGGAAE